jgi:predicted DNA binding protein
VEIEVEPEMTDRLLEDLKSNDHIAEEDLAIVGPGLIKGALTTDECLGCCSAIDTGVFQISGRMGPDGRLVQELIAPDRDAIREMVANMESHGHTVTLLKIASVDVENPLTPRQETVLQTAFERGYFDEPKGVALVDLAKQFDVSVSTASEIIRKAQRKLMQEYFCAPS